MTLGTFNYEIVFLAFVGVLAALLILGYERLSGKANTHYLRLFITTPILGGALLVVLFQFETEESATKFPDELVLLIFIVFATVGNFFALMGYVILRRILRRKFAEQSAASDR